MKVWVLSLGQYLFKKYIYASPQWYLKGIYEYSNVPKMYLRGSIMDPSGTEQCTGEQGKIK